MVHSLCKASLLLKRLRLSRKLPIQEATGHCNQSKAAFAAISGYVDLMDPIDFMDGSC